MTCAVYYSGYSRQLCVDIIYLIYPNQFVIYQDSKKFGLPDSSNLVITNSDIDIKINSAITKFTVATLISLRTSASD